MARKPADKIAASNKPYGRQDIWTAIRKLGKADARFTVRDIFDECGHEISNATIKTYMDGLIAAGFLELCAPKVKFTASVFSLLIDHGAEAPRINRSGEEVTQGLGTEAMWRTMKTLGAFTTAELALASSTSKAVVMESAASDYLKFMKHAGYVREVSKATPGKPARLMFVRSRDPGPKPPQIQRIKQVFDPNSGTVVWPKAGVGK